ncbi:MAG: hypothetical protein LBD92_07595 [Oscillospiraceae bacterium]|jgi:hypothetical protein|nr:hypothetical protein [Oscillospiraceae bacterium]
MKNYTVLDKGRVTTPCGVFDGVEKLVEYETGEILGLNFNARNILRTRSGEFVPFYEQTARRKNKLAVECHKNGALKAAALNEPGEVPTPVGALPAELVTFYDTGELSRVFPRDGAISGYWTEEDERRLYTPLSFDFGFTRFTALVSCVAFYRSGAVRSVTLFPGELIRVTSPVGDVAVSGGFSLYEDGALASCEPSYPVKIPTPIGVLTAHDPRAAVVSADSCSLRFNRSGAVSSLRTARDAVAARLPDGRVCLRAPAEAPHPSDGDQTVTAAMTVAFGGGVVTIDGESFDIGECDFTVAPYAARCGGCESCGDCGGCA